jgi:hypothetical protein
MKTRGNYILTMVLTISLFSGYAQASKAERPKRNLQFEISDKPIQWETNELGRMRGGRGGQDLAKETRKGPKGIGITEPNYVASFMIRDNRNINNRNPNVQNSLVADYDEEFKKIAKHSMSKQQNIFLTQQASSHMVYTSSGIYVEYKLYAVTKEEARKMAETYLKWLDEKAYKALQERKHNNEQIKIILMKDQGRMSQILKNLESFNKVKETSRIIFPVKDKTDFVINYDNLPTADIQNRVFEYHNMLNMLEIDIAGYEAKAKTLRKLMGTGSLQTDSHTHQMLIQAEVELAGAMARRQVIIASAKVMNSYLDAIQNIQKIEKERKTLTVKIARLQADLPKSEETLSNPPGYMRPVEVFMNRITIHPVKKGEDKSG